MPRLARFRFFHLLTAVLVTGAGLGCDDALGPATAINTIDTVTLYALNGTPIALPSAYSLLDELPVRTDSTPSFDFAFDITAAGTPLIYPSGVLGLSTEPGLRRDDRTFDEIRTAPVEGYQRDSTLAVEAEDVFLVRSRSSLTGCLYYFGNVPRYGKFRVIGLDLAARTITLETLVNRNCGFKSLEPGTPES
jgi:hypothetical protein